MRGDITRLYSNILTDWVFGSFFGATFDKLFGYVPFDNLLIGVFGAILQLTLVSFLVHETLYATGLRQPDYTIQSSFIMWLAIWQMSPVCVSKLTSAYYRFHIFLYGQSSKKTSKKTAAAVEKPSGCKCKD